MRRSILLVLAAFAALPVLADREWGWRMPSSVYSQLEFTQRASVDRAVKTFENAESTRRWRNLPAPKLVPIFRSAAAEWRKVQIQAEAEGASESLIAYAMFMQGYSRMFAYDRNEAIKIFNEVLDLYDEEQNWIVIPARYFLARATADNGDTKAAKRMFDELLDDDAAKDHAIVARCVRERAGSLWNQGKEQEAHDMWERGLNPVFRKVAYDDWRNCRDSLVTWTVVCGKATPAMFTEALLREYSEDDKNGRANELRGTFNNYPWYIRNGWGGWGNYIRDRVKTDERGKRFEALEKMFDQWAKDVRPIIAVGKYKDGYDVTMAHVKIQKCVRDKKYDAARQALYDIRDLGSQRWARYDLEKQLGDWEGALRAIEEILNAKPDEGTVRRLKWDKCEIYRHRVGQGEKALPIYRELNEPPRTQWEIAHTCRELKKNKEAYAMIHTLQGLPGEAAAATWTEAQWQESDGAKEKAIALYRRLLSQPEWKTTQYSSWAHQALERHGIKTGGAMTNEVH